MTLTAFLHGYPPHWSMGGEVSTHRTLRAVPGSKVATPAPEPYELDGVSVVPLHGRDAQSVMDQAQALGATVLFAHSSLSDATVRAARALGLPSILAVHAPPRYAADLRHAWSRATVRLYNTEAARKDWRDPKGWLLHPPAGEPCVMPAGPHDAYVSTSSLLNKGVSRVLRLARDLPERRFIIVQSPAHGTHGSPDFWDLAAALPNVEVWPRLHPDDMGQLWAQARILLVPSRYETYGMSAVEAAHHGIPSVHVDTPHVREGIGEAAWLLHKHSYQELKYAVSDVENYHGAWSDGALLRAGYLAERERAQLAHLPALVAALTPTRPARQPRARR